MQSAPTGDASTRANRWLIPQRCNALCHGAWTDYDEHTGRATLRYWPRGRWDEDAQSERLISRDDLAKIGRTTVDLTVHIVNAVTRQGIQFPGTTSPGKEVLAPKAPK